MSTQHRSNVVLVQAASPRAGSVYPAYSTTSRSSLGSGFSASASSSSSSAASTSTASTSTAQSAFTGQRQQSVTGSYSWPPSNVKERTNRNGVEVVVINPPSGSDTP